MNQVTIKTEIEKLEMIKPTKDTAPTYLVHKVDTDLVTNNYALSVYTNGKSMTDKMLVSRTDKKLTTETKTKKREYSEVVDKATFQSLARRLRDAGKIFGGKFQDHESRFVAHVMA